MSTKLEAAARPLHSVETINYWADAYSNPASGEHFQGHGMVVALLREYASLREALAEQQAAEQCNDGSGAQATDQAAEWMAVASSAVLALSDAASWLPDGQNKRTVALAADRIQDRARALYTSTGRAAELVADMTRAAAVKHIKATLAAFGPAAPITLAQDTWANLHDAMSILVAPPQQAAEPAKQCATPEQCKNTFCAPPCPGCKPAPTQQPLTSADVRRAGGIVHSDGNVFFTNLDMLNKAIAGSKT